MSKKNKKRQIEVDLIIRILEFEKLWSTKNFSVEKISKDFRDGFIAGITQSEYLITEAYKIMAESDA